jgi:hypothetical protein
MLKEIKYGVMKGCDLMADALTPGLFTKSSDAVCAFTWVGADIDQLIYDVERVLGAKYTTEHRYVGYVLVSRGMQVTIITGTPHEVVTEGGEDAPIVIGVFVTPDGEVPGLLFDKAQFHVSVEE